MGHPLWTQLQLSEKPEYFSKKDQAKVVHTFYVKKKNFISSLRSTAHQKAVDG